MRQLLIFAGLTLGLHGCAAPPTKEDPFETFNRQIYTLNRSIDKAFIRPVAYIYWRAVPPVLQQGVTNFFGNVDDVSTAANNLLQGKPGDAMSDATRVVINSSVGLLGLFDVASGLGLEKHNEDFGQTLAVWGVEESEYLVLPFFGPSTVRDAAGRIVDFLLFSPYPHINDDKTARVFMGIETINARAGFLHQDKLLKSIAQDEYRFVRSAYFQRREYLINDQTSLDTIELSDHSEDISEDDLLDYGEEWDDFEEE